MITRRSFVLGVAALAARPVRSAETDVWGRLREGTYVILMRHASTVPGLGDPPGLRLGDCATQRNLSEEGRAEARRIGERFRAERVSVARVYTSPWCRCRETAMLAFGSAEDWEPLSSFFDFPHLEPEFTERVKKRIGAYGRKPPGDAVASIPSNAVVGIGSHVDSLVLETLGARLERAGQDQ